MSDKTASYLADNIRALRASRGLTQAQLAKASGVPRPTWANLESGGANPTLHVLTRVAAALQVGLEELVSPPRAAIKVYRKAELPKKTRGPVQIRMIIPDPLPGLVVERLEIPSGAHLTGVPHTAGTREYLTCESGQIELVASGETYRLEPGDVVVFRGDQRHSYRCIGRKVAVGYSTLVLGANV